MENRTEKSLKNIIYAITGQFSGIIISLASRFAFVKILSSEYLGLSSLFTNILTILSLAELGFGTAMACELYKPISDNDVYLIKSLMKLYKKIYIWIGIIIIALGIITIPIYPSFINEQPDIENLDFIYLLFVINAAVSYFFAYKRLLIISDQKKYIDTIYKYVFYFILNILQILVLIIFKNYILFLITQTIMIIVENFAISIKANKLYPYLKEKDIGPVPKECKDRITQNVRALFFHKFGGVVLNSTDNIVISKVLGLVWVGIYSNYYLIINALNTMIAQFFNSIVASIGNLEATSTKEKVTEVFEKIFFANFWIYAVCCTCLVSLFNPFIEIWLGNEYLIDIYTVIIIVINFYILGMRRTLMAYREATGNYSKDWYSPILEAVINIVSSIILAKYLGLAGVFLGTIISSLFTNFWIEPLVVSKKSLTFGLKEYLLQHFKYTLLTVCICIAVYGINSIFIGNSFLIFACKTLISLIVPNIILLAIYRKNEKFIFYTNYIKEKILKRS